MLRNQIYTAFNTFLHVEDNLDAAIKSRKATLFLDDVPLLQSALISFKVNNQFKFTLHKILQEVQTEMYSPEAFLNLEDCLLEAQPAHTRNLKIVVSNMSDTSPIETIYKILLCKMPVERFVSLKQDTLQVNFQNLLSNRDEIQEVSVSQPLFMHTLVGFETEAAIYIQVFAKYVFEDETDETIEIASLPDAPNDTVLGFYFTLAQLKAKIPTVLKTKTLQYCSICFVAQIGEEREQISPECFYVEDKAYYQDEKTIVYQNQYGVYESLRFLGTVAKENEASLESLLNEGEEKNISARFRKKLSLTLGSSQNDIEAITDDLSLSKNIYLIESGKAIALVKDFKNLKSFDSSTVNDSPVFEFKYPYEY